MSIDPNLFLQFAKVYMQGIALPQKGQEGYWALVNSDGTNFAYAPPVTVLPAFIIGDAYKVLQVNVGGTAVEWTDSPSFDEVTSQLALPTNEEVTIASGAAVPTSNAIDLLPETGTSDTLTDINDPGWPVGTVLVARNPQGANSIAIEPDTGNIRSDSGRSHTLVGGGGTVGVLLIKVHSSVWRLVTNPTSEFAALNCSGTLDVGTVHATVYLPTVSASTITSDAITPTSNVAELAPESGTTDDLANINDPSWPIGTELILNTSSVNAITIKNGTGNIVTTSGADEVLTFGSQLAILKKTTSSTWLMVNEL